MSKILYAHADGFLRNLLTGAIGNSWIADAFVLGTTEVTAANTGPRVSEASLANYSGDLTNFSAGEVIDRLFITGKVRPTISGLTFRDCLALGGTAPVGTSPTAIFDQTGTSSGVNIYEFCEARTSVPSYHWNGFKGGNFKAVRCKISGVTDAFSPHGSSTVTKTVEIEGCYADQFNVDADPNQGDNITHNDGIQSAGKLSKLWITGCSIGTSGRPRTSNVLLQTNQGPYSASGVKINQNWFRGHATEGSSVNVPINLDGIPFEFVGNRVWSDGHAPRILILAATQTAGTSTISGNVDELGNPATITNA